MTGIQFIRTRSIDELTDWLFDFALNCEGKGKADIRAWLVRDVQADGSKDTKEDSEEH